MEKIKYSMNCITFFFKNIPTPKKRGKNKFYRIKSFKNKQKKLFKIRSPRFCASLKARQSASVGLLPLLPELLPWKPKTTVDFVFVIFAQNAQKRAKASALIEPPRCPLGKINGLCCVSSGLAKQRVCRALPGHRRTSTMGARRSP